jgi:hypothetical protein
MTRRVVRVTTEFFILLDQQLPDQRGPNGEPTAAEFAAGDLMDLVEEFATHWDDLATPIRGRTDYRVLITTTHLVPYVSVYAQVPAGLGRLATPCLGTDPRRRQRPCRRPDRRPPRPGRGPRPCHPTSRPEHRGARHHARRTARSGLGAGPARVDRSAGHRPHLRPRPGRHRRRPPGRRRGLRPPLPHPPVARPVRWRRLASR